MSGYYADLLKQQKPQALTIKAKKSQSEKKKEKKEMLKLNKKDGLTEEEFDLLMLNDNKNNIKKIKYILPKLDELNESAIHAINKNLLGEEFVDWLKINSENLLGSDLLNVILSKISDPNKISWISMKEYGSSLKFLLENNIKDQLRSLLIVQHFCQKMEFPKILIKDSEHYLIKIIYQLLFMNEIIDESVYYEWNDNIDNIDGITDKIRNILLIQTTDFFIILKTIFIEEENIEDDKNKENEILIDIKDNIKNENNKENNKENEENEENNEENEEFTLDDI